MGDYNHIDIQDDNFRPTFVFGLEDDLKQETEELIEKIRGAFENWLNHVILEFVDKKLVFKEDAIFLNFNYTLTLEKIYNIPSKNILHIHGDIENNQGLIFGHNKELEEEPELELDKNGDSNRTMFTDSENTSKYPFYAFQKPVIEIISENKNFFESMRSIEEIIILGHSLNPIDISYFEEIKKQTKDTTRWNVSFNKEKEKEKHLKKLLEIGIERNSIGLFYMN